MKTKVLSHQSRAPWARARLGLLIALAAGSIFLSAGLILQSIRGWLTVMSTGWRAPSAMLVLHNGLSHASVLALAGFLVFVPTLTGFFVLKWAGRGVSTAGLNLVAVSFPIGIGCSAIAFLGLLLTRLWFLPLMCVFFVIPVWLQLWRGTHRVSWPSRGDLKEYWPLMVVTLVLLPWMLIPELQIDGWEYYLSGPDGWMRTHGLTINGADPPVFYPFTAEMLFSLPIAFGHDAAVKWLNAAMLVAGVAGAAKAMEVRVRSALLVTLTAATSVYVFTCGKNEGFEAGFVLLSFALGWAGVRRANSAALVLSAIFAGLAFSTKYVAALNIAWIPVLLWSESPRRRLGFWALWSGLALLVMLPWLAKSYLLTGDPFYPMLSGLFPEFVNGWDLRNSQVWRLVFRATMPAVSIWHRLKLGLMQQHLVLAVTLPFVLFRAASVRKTAVLAGIVYLVWLAGLWGPQTVRWAFPGSAILLLVAATEVDRWIEAGGAARLTASVCLALGLVYSMGDLAYYPNPVPYVVGSESSSDLIRRHLTSFYDAHEAVTHAKTSPGILLVGEGRAYQLPRPCLLGVAHASGDAPLIWRAVNASASLRELEVKFHQLGVHQLVYNYVTIKLIQEVLTPFHWDDRMLRLYEAFCRRHLKLIWQSEYCDYKTGGYAAYRVEPFAAIGDSRSTYFLPGAEAFSQEALPFKKTGHLDEAIGSLTRLVKTFPDVGCFKSELGSCYAAKGDNAKAAAWLGDALKVGVYDSLNLAAYGLAESSIGKFAEADQALRAALPRYRDSNEVIRVGLGTLRYNQAMAKVAKNELLGAKKYLEEGAEFLDFEPTDEAGKVESSRRQKLAYIDGLRGDLASAAGQPKLAVEYYRAAYAIGSQLPGAANWDSAAKALEAKLATVR